MTFLAGIFGKDLVHERSAKQQLVYVTRLYYTVVASHTINVLSKFFVENSINILGDRSQIKLEHWVSWLVSQMLTYSLSKCSNYPLFIFLCPKIESKQYPWKKPNTLNYPNSIQEILAMRGKKKSPTHIRKTKQKTPWTIWILHEHRIFFVTLSFVWTHIDNLWPTFQNYFSRLYNSH